MKRATRIALAAACSLVVAAGASTPASASFVIDGGSTQSLPIAGNSFNTQITAEGFTRMTSDGQLRVSQAGYIDFYYIGAESGFNNSFMAQSGALSGNNKGFLTEHNEAFNFAGYAGFTIAVAANDIVNFSFTSDDANALTPVDNFGGSNLQGLGIYFNPGAAPLQQVLLGYDDQIFNDDDDFEDMLVRADFRPSDDNGGPVVPLPASAWLLGSGLVGLAGFRRRRTNHSA